MTFQRIDPKHLNGRQKEIYNFQKSAATLADYGFNCIKLSDDWLGADFLAYRFDGKTTLRVQLKSRVTIDQKYKGQDLWMNFQAGGTWYLMPHDTLVEIVGGTTNWLKTRSWIERGSYSSGSPSVALLEMLSPFALGLDSKVMGGQLPGRTGLTEPSGVDADTNVERPGSTHGVGKQWRHPNVGRAADALARYGYVCSAPPEATQYVDIVAQRPEQADFVSVRAPGRVGIYKKWMGSDIHVIFPDILGIWYLVPHDELVKLVGDTTPWLQSVSWRDRGGYSAASPSRRLSTVLREFALNFSPR